MLHEAYSNYPPLVWTNQPEPEAKVTRRQKLVCLARKTANVAVLVFSLAICPGDEVVAIGLPIIMPIHSATNNSEQNYPVPTTAGEEITIYDSGMSLGLARRLKSPANPAA
jgi:hypothetical protein